LASSTFLSPLFRRKLERLGDFVLLSSNADSESDDICQAPSVRTNLDDPQIKHVAGCRHIQSRNIMLIQWHGDVACRVGLSKVGEEEWKKIETRAARKTIILA